MKTSVKGRKKLGWDVVKGFNFRGKYSANTIFLPLMCTDPEAIKMFHYNVAEAQLELHRQNME